MTDLELVQLLKKKFGNAKRAANNWVRFTCPTCRKDDSKKMKRGLHLQSLKTKCFICEIPLTFADLVGSNINRIETAQIDEIQEEHPQARQCPFKKLIPINALAPVHPAILHLSNDHLFKYDEYWEKNRIGFIPPSGGLDIVFPHEDREATRIYTGNSLFYPVTRKHELVGWQIRFLEPHRKMKYLQIFLKGNYLFNYDQAREQDVVVVTEGVKKALKFGKNGVATLGKGISDRQIQIIQEWKAIIFLYDGDDKTQDKAKELVAAIKLNRNCVNIDPRDYGFPSPDEATEEQCKALYVDALKKLNHDH